MEAAQSFNMSMRAVSNKQREEEQFADLLDTYHDQIYALIRRMVIDHDDAADVLQDTFIKVWEKRDTFRGESNLYTWIYKIATNQCLEFIRKKKRRTILSLNSYEDTLSNKLESDSYFDGDEYQRIFQKALLTLPEKQRMVFQLKYFDEMKYDEMSAILDTSVGALKASYHHAVKKIEVFVKDQLNH